MNCPKDGSSLERLSERDEAMSVSYEGWKCTKGWGVGCDYKEGVIYMTDKMRHFLAIRKQS